MIKIIHVRNTLCPEEGRAIKYIDNLCDYLMSQWVELPRTVVIYHEQVGRDVTPRDEQGIEYLQTLTGTFLIYEYPGDPVTALIVVGTLVASAYLASKLAPDPPAIPAAARNVQAASPNNELSARTNVARPNGRIPDIVGEQISTPDLIAGPYSIYEDHRELEFSYTCASRGELHILSEDIRDGETRVLDIEGAAVDVYGPFTSPNSGSPQLSIGSVGASVLFTKKSSAVNGQVLLPPEDGSAYIFNGTFRFYSPSYSATSVPGVDLIDVFGSGPILVVVQADPYDDPLGGPEINLSGTYLVSVGTTTLAFFHPDQTPGVDTPAPELVNEDWLRHRAAYPYPGVQNGPYISCFIYAADMSDDNWVGPFTLDNPDLTSVITNFVAPQGMYRDDGLEQTSTSVVCQLEITRVNPLGVAVALPEYFNFSVVGSATLRNQRAATITPAHTTRGRMKVRARRLTRRDTSYEGQVSDEVRWKDLYGTYVITQEHFGDVTTIHTKTLATDGALSVKERKLNLTCTRKVRTVSATPTTYTLSEDLQPSKRMMDILVHLALDPYIGNRKPKDLNFFEIQQAQLDCEARFGTSRAAEFSYTFDKGNISFEECANTVAEAAFCIAYRRGHVITASFEGPQTAAKLAFGHRNKLPGTEKRSYGFGNNGDFDGIEYDYMDEDGQTPKTIYVPEDRTAVNPKTINSVGVRNQLQAYFQANRIYNKLRKQRVSVEFEATQEAQLLTRNDHILVADNTRPYTQDGEIVGKTDLVLRTSQPVVFDPAKDYTVFLQLTDGTVQAITATQGSDQYEIVITDEPSLELSVNPSNFTLATYILVADDDSQVRQFMVQERLAGDRFTHTIRAINYDSAYYANDLDYINREVDEGGGPIGLPGGSATWSGLSIQFYNDGSVWSIWPGVFGFPAAPWFAGAPIEGVGWDYYIRLTRMSGTPNLGIEQTTDGAGGGTGVTDTDWQLIEPPGPWFIAAALDGGTVPSGFVRYEVSVAGDDEGFMETKIGEAVFTVE